MKTFVDFGRLIHRACRRSFSSAPDFLSDTKEFCLVKPEFVCVGRTVLDIVTSKLKCNHNLITGAESEYEEIYKKLQSESSMNVLEKAKRVLLDELFTDPNISQEWNAGKLYTCFKDTVEAMKDLKDIENLYVDPFWMTKTERTSFLHNSIHIYRAYMSGKNYPNVTTFNWMDKFDNLNVIYGRTLVSELKSLPRGFVLSLVKLKVPNAQALVDRCLTMSSEDTFKCALNNPHGVALLYHHITIHPNDDIEKGVQNPIWFPRNEVMDFGQLVFGGTLADIHRFNILVEKAGVIPKFTADICNILPERGALDDLVIRS